MGLISNRGPSPFIQGFQLQDVTLNNGITLRVATGGSGPALVMLHGHPQNHLCWHKVAPVLAQHYTVVLPDLRGYGDSDKPASDAQHRPYSKRAMAQDIALLMTALGHPRFAFVGHDRGARVGHRLALDYPDRVSACTFIDIAPTATMYQQTDREFATRYFWWFFLIQPEPLPETLIGSNTEFFLRQHIRAQLKVADATPEAILKDYLRCYQHPAMVHAVCEDYRASATIDLEDDAASAGERIRCPLLLLWGEQGTVGQLYDVPQTWADKASHIQGRALPCGHSPQEEVPSAFLAELQAFLNSAGENQAD